MPRKAMPVVLDAWSVVAYLEGEPAVSGRGAIADPRATELS
jgi:hypothetical protein